MALPFYARCETSSPRFYEVSSGRFQQLDRGVIPPFVPGFQFLLVVNELADFLRTLGLEGVSFENATLYDPRTGAEVRTHTCLRVHKSLDADIRVPLPEGYRTLVVDDHYPLDGYRMLVASHEYYFVSPALKEALVGHGFAYLRFSEGFSDFFDAA
jgi:hypothetical protein